MNALQWAVRSPPTYAISFSIRSQKKRLTLSYVHRGQNVGEWPERKKRNGIDCVDDDRARHSHGFAKESFTSIVFSFPFPSKMEGISQQKVFISEVCLSSACLSMAFCVGVHKARDGTNRERCPFLERDPGCINTSEIPFQQPVLIPLA